VLAQHQFDELSFWAKPSSALCKAAKLTEKQQQHWAAFRQKYQPQDYWEFLQRKQIRVVFDIDKNYPELLKQLDDRPPILFTKGELPDQINFPLAVVGTRRMTGYGQMVTEKIVKELADFSATIISGLMYGVDSLAHEVALQAGTASIGVLGYGFNHCYPVSHQTFIESFLARKGVCITELAPHIKPEARYFPQRNRIVAGMSWGVLVTEAGLQSGSHITAALAGIYGREVFAVPGSIMNPYSEGTKWLINQGAALVSSGQEIRDILASKLDPVLSMHTTESSPQISPAMTNCPAANLVFNNQLEQDLYQLLCSENYTMDDLAVKLTVSIAELSTALSGLEIQGVVQQLGDVWLAK
jgi:DNA processing protein